MQELRREVALACRVLAHAGLAADVLGHVSVRAEGGLLVRCRGPAESGLLFTTAADVHLVGPDGRADLPGGYAVPGELPIHAATLRARPDVRAVVHAHPPALVAADLAGLTLRPVVGAYNIPAARMARDGIPGLPPRRADPPGRAGAGDARRDGYRTGMRAARSRRDDHGRQRA